MQIQCGPKLRINTPLQPGPKSRSTDLIAIELLASPFQIGRKSEWGIGDIVDTAQSGVVVCVGEAVGADGAIGDAVPDRMVEAVVAKVQVSDKQGPIREWV